jgi:hypothetical protein
MTPQFNFLNDGENYIQTITFLFNTSKQGCGAKTIFFRSGSDFQKVSAPAPAPATALEPPIFTDFMLKRTFFMLLMKENRPNSHVRSYSK